MSRFEPADSRHDLSWGTKGADTVQEVDLGAVQGVGKHVEVELVSAQQDIDIAYQDALDNIRLKRAKVDEAPPSKKEQSEQQQKDTYVGVIRSLTDLTGQLQNKRELDGNSPDP
jgi:hypothetical protein